TTHLPLGGLHLSVLTTAHHVSLGRLYLSILATVHHVPLGGLHLSVLATAHHAPLGRLYYLTTVHRNRFGRLHLSVHHVPLGRLHLLHLATVDRIPLGGLHLSILAAVHHIQRDLTDNLNIQLGLNAHSIATSRTTYPPLGGLHLSVLATVHHIHTTHLSLDGLDFSGTSQRALDVALEWATEYSGDEKRSHDNAEEHPLSARDALRFYMEYVPRTSYAPRT
ncbi:hypothetical protein B0H21DRAFT_768856, partial [Amylocystis lapponica]